MTRAVAIGAVLGFVLAMAGLSLFERHTHREPQAGTGPSIAAPPQLFTQPVFRVEQVTVAPNGNAFAIRGDGGS